MKMKRQLSVIYTLMKHKYLNTLLSFFKVFFKVLLVVGKQLFFFQLTASTLSPLFIRDMFFIQLKANTDAWAYRYLFSDIIKIEALNRYQEDSVVLCASLCEWDHYMRVRQGRHRPPSDHYPLISRDVFWLYIVSDCSWCLPAGLLWYLFEPSL